MLRELCRAKIHRATVTEANLQYHGSITIDRALLAAADLWPGEKVQVVNLHNGARMETYCCPGKARSGTVCLNGAAARSAQVGDAVIIMAFCLVAEPELARFRPRIVFVDQRNRVTKVRRSV